MAVETADDRAAFIADFGVLADWTVGATLHDDILVLFDNGTIDQSLQDTVSAQNRRATITLPVADVPAGAGAATDTIAVGGSTYHPKPFRRDGEGFVVIHLEAA